jgi:hypothetical protein
MALLIAGGVAYFVKGNEDIVSQENEADLVEAPARQNSVQQAVVPAKTESPPLAELVIDGAGAVENPVPEPELPELPEVADTVAAPDTTGRCGGSVGSLVGYFYAGDSFAGLKGEPYTMGGDVNVRADYPHKENGWSSLAKIRCVLVRDDVLVLSENALKVDGEKYWVPLYAGDLQKR